MTGYAAAETDRRMTNAIRYGRITAVDAATARARVTFGGETESAWLPFTAGRAGAARVWTPPTVGEQVVVVSPAGDTAQGVIMGSLPSDQFPAPSGNGGAVVLDLGSVNVTLTASSVAVVVGGVTFEISGGGVAITGGAVTHNGKNIGSTHTHTAVAAGVATSGPPA